MRVALENRALQVVHWSRDQLGAETQAGACSAAPSLLAPQTAVARRAHYASWPRRFNRLIWNQENSTGRILRRTALTDKFTEYLPGPQASKITSLQLHKLLCLYISCFAGYACGQLQGSTQEGYTHLGSACRTLTATASTQGTGLGRAFFNARLFVLELRERDRCVYR